MQLNFTRKRERVVFPAEGSHQTGIGLAIKKQIVMQIKLTTFILLVGTTVSARGYSQKITLSENNVPLTRVMRKIEKQSGYQFLYFDSDIKHDKRVVINVKNAEIGDVLEQCFKGQDLTYNIVGKTIVVGLRTSPPPGNTTLNIHGRVSSEEGKPVPGATVHVKGFDNATATDEKGDFSIEAPDNSILVVSFIGYDRTEIPVNGQSIINVTLKVSNTGLNSLVVVAYGTQKKIDLTGSIATMSGRQLTEVPVASVTQALAGRLPGLVFKETTGKPGSIPYISIRGFGAPLIIVDGVEQDNYTNIDPNNIESFSILKDASAAIYGARAGNGVILITTKRGNIGAPVITFNTSASIQAPTIYPKFVNSWEYATIQNEAKAFAGQPAVYSDADIEKFKAGTDPAYPNNNMYNEVVKRWSLMQNDNLNVSGGNSAVRYFLSMGYLFQDGIYRSSGVNLNRYNLRSNIDVNVTKNISVSVDLSGRYTVNHDVPAATSLIFQSIGTSPNIYPGSYPDPSKTPYDGRNAISPLNLINPDLSGTNNTNEKYLTAAITLNYKIPSIKGLEATIKGNFIGDGSYNKLWTTPYSTYYYDRNDNTYSLAASGSKYSLTETYSNAEYLTLQGLLNYQHAFGDNSIKGLFVYEVIDDRSNSFNGYKDGFASGAIQELFAGSNANMSTNGSASEDSRMSYAGRINYSYKDKYLAEATLRYDASSLFPPATRWGLFPSISLGWRLSEENFMKNNTSFSFVDNLKLRLSYSHTGYDLNAADYEYLSTYSFNSQYAFGTTPYQGLVSNGVPNPVISWEDIYTYNSGLDIDLWNGLLGIEADVFYRLRTHVLGRTTATLPTTFGGTLPLQNINSTDNRGFELVLNHKNSIGKFHYSVSANVSWTRSKYVKFVEQVTTDSDLNRLNLKTGQWTDRTFGYKTDGFWQSQKEIESSPVDNDLQGNKSIHPGMVKYVDVNGDNKIDFRDEVVIGRGTTPEMMFGFNFNASYRGFDLYALWQGAADFDIAFTNNMLTLSINNGWNSYQFLFNGRWTPDNPNAPFPATTPGINPNNVKGSDLWRKSGEYIRLKNISFGYTLPENISKRIRLNNVRVYLAGYNILTFDKLGKFPFDPEAGDGSSWYYPEYKSYSFGLSISL